MASEEEAALIGRLVSVTSKINIRYEGTLDAIDTVDSKITLSNVRSFGTEGRIKDGPQIPPGDNIYNAVIFNAKDIKDLRVISESIPHTSSSLHNDPAIIQTQMPQKLSPVPNNPSSSSSQITKSPQYQKAPQFTDLLYQPPISSETSQITNLPLYNSPLSSTVPKTTKSPDQRDEITDWPLYLPPINTKRTSSSSTQITNLPLYRPYSSSSLSTYYVTPSKTDITNLPVVNSSAPYLTLANPHPPPVPPFLNLNTSNPNPNPSSSVVKTVQDIEKSVVKTVQHVEKSSDFEQVGTSSGTNPSKTLNPILPSQSHRKAGPVQFSRSASYNNSSGRGRGRGHYTNNSNDWKGRGVEKYTEDFDFEAMNEKFNKDEVWGMLNSINLHHNDDFDDNNNEDCDEYNEEDKYYHSDDQNDISKMVYNKEEFFDCFSGYSQHKATPFSQQVKLNAETFGHVPRYRGSGRAFRGGRGRDNIFYKNNINIGRGRGLNDFNNRGRGYGRNPNPNSDRNFNPNPNPNRGRGNRGYYASRDY